MPSQRTFFRSLWIRRGSRRKQRAGRPSGTSSTVAQPRRKAMLPGVGGGLTALAILGCAFGPMPDESTAIDATIREEGVRTPRNVIDKFLADSRQYLGL
jgi:hypothetical protein